MSAASKFRTASCLLFLLSIFTTQTMAQTWTKQLADGVILTQTVKPSSTHPLITNLLKIDPKAPGISIKTVLGQGRVFGKDATKGRETVSSIAKRLNAVAVVNAGYFWQSGDPLNISIVDGELVSEPYPGRVVFGITRDGRFLFDTLTFDAKICTPDAKTISIRGLNRLCGKNDIVAYTPRFFPSTCTTGQLTEAVIKCDSLPIKANTPIAGTVVETRPGTCDTPIADGTIVVSGTGPSAQIIGEQLKPGMPVTIQFDLKPTSTCGWENVVESAGGGPWLVRDGKVYVNAKEEGFQNDISVGSNPRTAIGITADGKMVIATVDGRQSTSKGITLAQLADLMKAQGCVNAINFDGGGSTTMSTSFGVLNSPSGGTERPIADSLAVMAASPAPSPSTDFAITAPATEVQSGSSFQLSLVDAYNGQPVGIGISEQAVWTTTGGAGFVDQSGRFYGVKAHSGSVIVRLGDKIVSVPISVVAGTPNKLTAKVQADPSGAPNRTGIAVSIIDLNSNPVKGQVVGIRVTGGIPDQTQVSTDDNGEASVGITLDGTSKKVAITVTCTKLASTIDITAKP